MSTIFWSLFHNGLSITLVVSILIGVFYLYGQAITSLLSPSREIPTTIAITAGMAVITFFAWYLCKIGIHLDRVIAVTVFVAAALATVKVITYLCIAEKKKSVARRVWGGTDYFIILAGILIFSAQSVMAFKFSGRLVGRVANNDIFSWALVANHFLGVANLENIYPGGSAFLRNMQVDAWGTYFNLALTAKVSGLPALEATPFFVVMSSTLITFALYEIAKKAFDLSRAAALAVAVLTGAGAFLFYIAYNGFYGQLLGSIFFLAVLLGILEISDSNGNFSANVTILTFPLVGLLLVYQSGYFVFAACSILFCILYTINRKLFDIKCAGNTLVKSFAPLLQILLALLVSAILLPELSCHTVHRTVVVSDALNGWPLPLISPPYLLSLPFTAPFPGVVGSLVDYGISALFFGLIVLCSAIYFKLKSIKLPVAALSFIALQGLAIVIYLLAYSVKGSIYQVWKLAAFTAIPTSFALNSLIVKNVLVAFSQKGKTVNAAVFLLFFLIVVGSAIAIPMRSVVDSYSDKIDSLKSVRDSALAEGVKTIVLALPPYGDTMAAFNYLSKDFKLVSLSDSYISQKNRIDVDLQGENEGRLLIPAQCFQDQSGGASINRFALVDSKDVLLREIPFNKGAECLFYRGVTLTQGFSGVESWGTWTVGGKAAIEVIIPKNLRGKDFLSKFEIIPFGAQSASVSGNGVFLGNYAFEKQTTISVRIPSEIVKDNKITFDFTIARPRSPREISPDTLDSRPLGLGFVSMVLNDTPDN